MSFFGIGNRTINSTQMGVISTPDTATLLAEVDLNDTMAHVRDGGEPYGVTWIVGSNGSTRTTFLLDQALSTGVGTTAIRDQTVAVVSSASGAQFYTKHNVFPGDRFRVRVASTVDAANAKIIAEPLS